MRKEKILSGRGLNASYRCGLLAESKSLLVIADVALVWSCPKCSPLRGLTPIIMGAGGMG